MFSCTSEAPPYRTASRHLLSSFCEERTAALLTAAGRVYLFNAVVSALPRRWTSSCLFCLCFILSSKRRRALGKEMVLVMLNVSKVIQHICCLPIEIKICLSQHTSTKRAASWFPPRASLLIRELISDVVWRERAGCCSVPGSKTVHVRKLGVQDATHLTTNCLPPPA